MVNRRNPAAGDPYPLVDVASRSVISTGATSARGSAAARAPDRLHHGGQPVTACGGVEAVGPTGRLSHRPGELPGGQRPCAAIARALASSAAVSADEPAGNRTSRASAEVPDLLRRCVTSFGQTAVMVTCDPVAAASSRPDSRRPAGWGRVPRRSSRAVPAGTHARPFRIRRHHLTVANITARSPGSIRHRKA